MHEHPVLALQLMCVCVCVCVLQTLTEGTKVTLTYELNRYTLKVLQCKPAKGTPRQNGAKVLKYLTLPSPPSPQESPYWMLTSPLIS